ncbi:MAG: AMP-binding protein [Burkholderiales bacterium]
MTTAVCEHVARNARKFPHRVALIGESQQLTYAELDAQANRLGAYLIGQGIQPGDKVALLAKSTIHWVVAYVAILKTRATCVPLNTRLTPTDIENNLADAECKLVVTDADIVQSHLAGRVNLPVVLVDGSQAPNAFASIVARSDLVMPAMQYSDDDLQLIMFTGGTTGRSKGVMLRNRQVFWNTVHEALDTGMHEFGNTMIVTPLHHAAALNCWLLPHLYLGAKATILSEYSPQRMLDMIHAHQATNGFTTPSIARELAIAAEAAPHKLASFTNWYVGGGILSGKDRERMHALVPGMKIHFQYGLTEAGVIVTVLKEEDYALAPDSIGRPFINFEVRIVREDLSPADVDECGEILVRGPSVMAGYYNRPEATAAAFHEGWLRTGDMGVLDANGYVHFRDRLKDMVKTGGLNVYSQEVERALQKHPAIREVGVIGLPSDKWGEEVTAVVVARPGMSIDEAEVIRFGKEQLASFKVPKRVFIVAYEELPINYSGKIVKRDLRVKFEKLVGEEVGNRQ